MTKQQSNYIKVIAVITMIIDHIGVIIFPDIVLLRIIGRISFPLFAYQIGEGYSYTKNLKKYMHRLFAFGISMQAIYAFYSHFANSTLDIGNINIFITLFLGVVAIYFYDHKLYLQLIFLFFIPILLSYFKINLDYGVYGILLILALYITRDNIRKMIFSMIFITLLYCCYFVGGSYIQLYSLLSLIFILMPLNLKINIPKYFFYLIYPTHIAIIQLIDQLIHS